MSLKDKVSTVTSQHVFLQEAKWSTFVVRELRVKEYLKLSDSMLSSFRLIQGRDDVIW